MEIMAGYYREGIDGVVEKSNSLALQWYQRAAEHGGPKACAILSIAFLSGTMGVEKDGVQALEWCKKGVELGSAYAINNYGYALSHGELLLERDENTSFEMFRRAAEMGMAAAMINLADKYISGGSFGAPNPTAALSWLEKGEIKNKDPLNPNRDLTLQVNLMKGNIMKNMLVPQMEKIVQCYRLAEYKEGVDRLDKMIQLATLPHL